MAAAQNKSKIEKTASSRSSGDTRKAQALERNKRRRNVWSVVLFAVGLLFIAFAFIGSADAESPNAWDLIHSFICGLFGVTALFIGPILIYVAVMISMDKSKSTLSAKIFQMALFVLLFSAAIQIIFVGRIGSEESENFFQTIGEVYQAGTHFSGGGVCSILLGAPLLLLGRVGASIIIVLIVFVVIMLMADISLMDFFRFVAKPFKKAGNYARAKREEYVEENAYASEEREKREKQERQELQEQQRRESRNAENIMRLEARHNQQKRSKKFSQLQALSDSHRAVEQDDEDLYIEEEQIIPEPVKNKAERPSDPIPADIGETDGQESEDLVAAQQREGEAFRSLLTGESRETGSEPVTLAKTLKEGEPASRDKEGGLIWSEGNTQSISENKDKANSAPEPVKNPPVKNPVDEAIDKYNDEHGEREQKEPAITNSEKNNTADNEKRMEEIIASAEQYKLPPVDLLNDIVRSAGAENQEHEIQEKSEILVNALKSFGVQTKFLQAVKGPSVTRYELQPAPGVKIAKITGLVDDISLNLATAGVRIEAPIPNKAAVGIEVPNREKETVFFREAVDCDAFRSSKSKLGSALGKNISGEVVICDIAEMPHILIAGTTGSGKSVCVNSIIMSILFRSTPEEVRLIMIDPKAVEFMVYNGIPHLLIPVVTDPKKAAGALSWAVQEMDSRYGRLGENGVRDIHSYNKLRNKNPDLEPMPQIVIFIDELADLMMTSKNDVEESICRLAQKARAAGIHLVIATQRPSVDVVTGLIKSNIPSRIALKVASQVDSRTIIDTAGAEKLLGKGDMLYKSVGMPEPMRVQGCWVSDEEVERVTDFIRNSFILDYDQAVIDAVDSEASKIGEKKSTSAADYDSDELSINDEKLDEAIDVVIKGGQASTSQLQRFLHIGYGRAAKLLDVMESQGIIGPPDGNKPRKVLISREEWYERKLNRN